MTAWKSSSRPCWNLFSSNSLIPFQFVKRQGKYNAALCDAVSPALQQSNENGSAFKTVQPDMCQSDHVHVAALHIITPVLRQESKDGTHVTLRTAESRERKTASV